MIDLHCHILPGIDDGSRNIDETMQILKRAANSGFNTICFTPHYIEPQYINTKSENMQLLEEVQKKIREEKISLELLLGNEIFIDENMVERLEERKMATLAETKYVLIEIPMYQEIPKEVVQKMINDVIEKGYKVIIAHPERYTYIQKNPKKILEYFGTEVIFQGNYASIIGTYGRETKKTVKKLLKEKIIHYFATDTHHIDRCIYDDIEQIKKKILKITGEEYFEILTEKNPKLILENKNVIKNIK